MGRMYALSLAFLMPVAMFSSYKLMMGSKTSLTDAGKSEEFLKFQKYYLVGFFISQAAHSLQSSHLFALFQHYEIEVHEISLLYLTGFVSMMVFGFFIGPAIDRFGSKRACLVYGGVYGLCCLCMLSKNYEVLLFGRVLSGIAVAILSSAFETWVMNRSEMAAFPWIWIQKTFALQAMGTGAVAIGAGVLAEGAEEMFGFVAPFLLAFGFLVLGTVWIANCWVEPLSNRFTSGSLSQAWTTLASNSKIALCGLTVVAFESCVYIHVFLWTPMLEQSISPAYGESNKALPHGVVYSSFMACVIIGSSIYQHLFENQYQPEDLLLGTCVIAGASMTVCAISSDHTLIFLSFLCFEMCYGAYLSGIGFIKGRFIQMESRATIMNLFSSGQIVIVLVVLPNIPSPLAYSSACMVCALLSFAACGAQFKLKKILSAEYAPVASSEPGN